MTKNLKISKDKIEKYTGELEDKVKTRTTELNEKIKESEIQRLATVNIANDLEEINVKLLKEIAERKQAEQELKKRLYEIEIFYNASLGREGRIIELKHQVNELLVQLGKKKKYKV
jgi:hypothetical protein